MTKIDKRSSVISIEEDICYLKGEFIRLCADSNISDLKHYNDMQSAYGNISLKLDDWQGASDARKQLLDDWGNVYHMDVLPFIYA